MIKWAVIAFLLCGFTPLYDTHDSSEKIDFEIRNMEVQVQDKQFTVLAATPALTALEDHQIVIISSDGWSTLMWRDGEEIYKVDGSCVTVK